MQSIKARQSLLIITLGVAFEHFDMMLVSLLASSITGEFIGVGSPNLSMLYAYIGYATAFLFRPLGAFLFGCIGDLYGRKPSLISSMILMSSATLGLGLMPGVQTLGLLTTILFLGCRIAQGLAIGGEYGTAMTYSYELKPKWRTFYGACVVSSTHLGGMAATFLAGLYADNFRMAFLLGGAVGLSLLFFRSFMKEQYEPIAKKLSEVASNSVKNKKKIAEAIIVASMVVLVFYGSLIYLNEILHKDFNIPRRLIFQANSLLLGLWMVTPPCIGYLADKYAYPYRKLMRYGACGVFLSAPLLGFALVFSSYPYIIAAQVLMHLFHMIFCLCTPRFFGDHFSSPSRNTAVSTSYSLGASFTAALAPVICYISIRTFQTNFAICLPFMLIASLAIKILKEKDQPHVKR